MLWLQSYFLAAAKPGSWQYHSGVLTDQTPEDISTNIIREKLLEYLPQEVPYSMTLVSSSGSRVGAALVSLLKSLCLIHHVFFFFLVC